MAEIRKRKGRENEDLSKEPSDADHDFGASIPKNSTKEKQLEPGSYWLTRIVFIRALGLIYCKVHGL